MAGFFKQMDKITPNAGRIPFFSPGEYPCLEIVEQVPFQGNDKSWYVKTILECVEAPVYRPEHLEARMQVSDENRTHFRQGDKINFQIKLQDKHDIGLRNFKAFVLAAYPFHDDDPNRPVASEDIDDEFCDALISKDQPLAGRRVSATVGVRSNEKKTGQYTRITFSPFREEEEEETPPPPPPPKATPIKRGFGRK